MIREPIYDLGMRARSAGNAGPVFTMRRTAGWTENDERRNQVSDYIHLIFLGAPLSAHTCRIFLYSGQVIVDPASFSFFIVKTERFYPG